MGQSSGCLVSEVYSASNTHGDLLGLYETSGSRACTLFDKLLGVTCKGTREANLSHRETGKNPNSQTWHL